MNNKLYDALEICLREIENGVTLENVLARFPDLAAELRPILKASVKARTLNVASAPSPEAIRRGAQSYYNAPPRCGKRRLLRAGV